MEQDKLITEHANSITIVISGYDKQGTTTKLIKEVKIDKDNICIRNSTLSVTALRASQLAQSRQPMKSSCRIACRPAPYAVSR